MTLGSAKTVGERNDRSRIDTLKLGLWIPACDLPVISFPPVGIVLGR